MNSINTLWRNHIKQDVSRKEFLLLAAFMVLIVLKIKPLFHFFGKSPRSKLSVSFDLNQSYGTSMEGGR